MWTRRRFAGALPVAIGGTAFGGCSSGVSDDDSYEAAAARTWRGVSPGGASGPPGPQAVQRELVRCATLAPSSHNTQCWKFAIEDRAITVLPDLSRRCPVVDPDDHHLFVSLGCAAENLIQAAPALGMHAEARFDTTRDAARIELSPGAARPTLLAEAIARRQSTRGDYDGKPLAAAELGLLERAGGTDRVRLLLLTEPAALEDVLALVVQGNTAQLSDPAFIDELKTWVRFNESEVLRRRDGLFGKSSGNPPLPSWLGPLLFDFVVTPKSENDKVARQLRSSAGVAVFVGATQDHAGWVEVGRAFERFALQATAMGVRHSHLNQPVEVAALRTQFASRFGLASAKPDLVIRFGRGATMPPSLRRPVEAVLA